MRTTKRGRRSPPKKARNQEACGVMPQRAPRCRAPFGYAHAPGLHARQVAPAKSEGWREVVRVCERLNEFDGARTMCKLDSKVIMGVQVGQARRLALPDRSVQASQGGGNRQRGRPRAANNQSEPIEGLARIASVRSRVRPSFSRMPPKGMLAPPAGSRCEGTRRPRLGSWCRGAEPHERDNIDGMEG